jgi:hypothetical protein
MALWFALGLKPSLAASDFMMTASQSLQESPLTYIRRLFWSEYGPSLGFSLAG